MPGRERGLAPFLRLYYAYVFLFDFMLGYAVYTALFALEGIGTAEIGVLLAFWSASAIVLEMPSGALSDHFDRRTLLIAAPLLKAVTFVLWGIADGNFWLYGLGFLFWSAGQALQSGTREALLFERMEQAGRSAEFDKVLGRDAAAEGLGIGGGALVGGFVAQASLDMAIWLSVVPLLFGALVAFWLHDTRPDRQLGPGENPITYLSHFRTAWGEFRRYADLRFVAVYMAVGLILFELLEEFDQLYYLAVGVPIWLWGVLAGAVELVYAVASVGAHRLAGRPWLAWALPLLGGALLVGASLGNNTWYVLLLELAYVVIAPVTVLAEARFHRIMDGESRATTTSALIMAENISGIAATLAFGFLAEWLGILPAYGWAGLFMLPVALWIILAQHRGARPIE
ncbi:MAG TPA: MFS transporter [Devosia sp.]